MLLKIETMSSSDKSDRRCCRIEGKYANHFAVGFSEYEFVMDFGQSFSGGDPPELCSRIISSPNYAKALLNVFAKSILEYEERYGTIEETAEPGDDPE